MLRLMTTDGLSSAFTAADEEDLLPEVVDSLGKAEEEPPRRRGRRPWKEMEFGFWWENAAVVAGVRKADALVAMLSSFSSSSLERMSGFGFMILSFGGETDTRLLCCVVLCCEDIINFGFMMWHSLVGSFWIMRFPTNNFCYSSS